MKNLKTVEGFVAMFDGKVLTCMVADAEYWGLMSPEKAEINTISVFTEKQFDEFKRYNPFITDEHTGDEIMTSELKLIPAKFSIDINY